jgi:undecaprenyl diphosphate synthase
VHTAIIMDGNGRWAHARGLPRLEGHRRGADAVRRTVEAAPGLAIDELTLYAFSSGNWRRPEMETSGLMQLFAHFLRQETRRCVEEGVRLTVIGRRDRLPVALRGTILETERRTVHGGRLHLRIAVDYSARESIVHSARWLSMASPEEIERGPDNLPPVDLLIRTGGEQRLSDFLLWECAYAELLFLPVLWPDFGAGDLASAIADFRSRQRRFGALPEGYCGIPA